jgi:predicted nucleotidyltransferase
MAYTTDMSAAARRLLDAARRLDLAGRRDVAAYLFGLAAECALKAVAQTIPEARRDEVLYAHFPELRTRLRDVLTGRRAQPLRRLIEDNAFLNEWEIKIRYARAEDIRDKPVEDWEAQAVNAIKLMEES